MSTQCPFTVGDLPSAAVTADPHAAWAVLKHHDLLEVVCARHLFSSVGSAPDFERVAEPQPRPKRREEM